MSGIGFTLSPGTGAADQVYDRFKVDQRFSPPVETNEREEPVLDPIPFAGAGRVMANGNSHSCYVAQILQVQFPGALPVSIAAAAVGANQQPLREGHWPDVRRPEHLAAVNSKLSAP